MIVSDNTKTYSLETVFKLSFQMVGII